MYILHLPRQLGQSRVFMKEELERRMEQMIVESAKRQVQTIQRCWRGYVGRKVFVRRRRATRELQATRLKKRSKDQNFIHFHSL